VTPLRSSTSIENYASSSKPSLIHTQRHRNFNNNNNLRTFKVIQNHKDVCDKNTTCETNPYNSISCLTIEQTAELSSSSQISTRSEKQTIESQNNTLIKNNANKLNYRVSSVGTQANMEKQISKSKLERKKSDLTNYPDSSDIESQVLSIEIDMNKTCSNTGSNSAVNDEYISVAELYKLANQKSCKIDKLVSVNTSSSTVESAASVIVNDYSAFKNSLNFQLQAAKAAAIADGNKDDSLLSLKNESKVFNE
jgi:hypothetical protein